MTPLTWSNRLQRMGSWIALLFVFLTLVPASTHGARSCPRDVGAAAASCLNNYKFHSQNLYNSPQKLCCGLDIEILRLFCHSYTKARGCVKQLKRSCPASEHPDIEEALGSFDQDRAGLQELCSSNDIVIENYAMYQACFMSASRQSEKCFKSYLDDSASIRFLSKVSTKHKDTFCRKMKNTVGCIQSHVHKSCYGDREADRMAVLLVRPMVQGSADCDYTSMESTATHDAGAPYMDHESRQNRGSKYDTISDGSNHHRRHQSKNKDRRVNTNTQGRKGEGPRNSASSLHPLTSFTSVFLLTASVLFVAGAHRYCHGIVGTLLSLSC